MSKTITKRVPQEFYSPAAWQVRELRQGRYLAECCGERLWIAAVLGGEWRVYNERSDGTHHVDSHLGCSCPHYEHQCCRNGIQTLCKHGAACYAVEEFISRGAREQDAAQRRRAAEQDIASVFGG